MSGIAMFLFVFIIVAQILLWILDAVLKIALWVMAVLITAVVWTIRKLRQLYLERQRS